MKRREFIKQSALGSAAVLMPRWSLADNAVSDQKLRVACIGVGGRGKAAVGSMATEQLVALVDVDEDRAAGTFKKFPDVPRFKDYRRMLDKLANEIDAVTISTPDHMHYPIAKWALSHGKHVFCEKPLTRIFAEAMDLKKSAAEAGVITQMGNQGHASDGMRAIREWVDAGLIGEIKEVHHWTNRPVWPQGFTDYPETAPTPNTLDWDLWCGVAPPAEYSPLIAPFKWRGFWNYGAGAIGDIACHAMDASYTALELGFPTHVQAETTPFNDLAFPQATTITFQFPGTDKRGPVTLYWNDGSRRPKDLPFVPNEFIWGDPTHDGKEKKGQTSGTALIGSKGAITADMYCGSPRIWPEDYFKQLRREDGMPAKTLPRIKGGHFNEWIDGIKAGVAPGSNWVDFAADFTAVALLGTVAIAAKTPIEFDPRALRITNNPAANALLQSRYEYRKEFLPG